MTTVEETGDNTGMNINITHLIIAVWFILFGLNALGIVAVSNFWLGLLALIAGIAMVISGFGVNTVYKR